MEGAGSCRRVQPHVASFPPTRTVTDMLLPIRHTGDPVLHHPAAEWIGDVPQLEMLAGQLEAACAAAGGVGIAAPQIGVARRVFLAHLDSGTILAANPVITPSGPLLRDLEGCLSIPGGRYEVHRHRDLVLLATGIDGLFELRLSGWDARVVQHEMDHLDGVLISDAGSPSKR